ncbi:hypothetical protein LY474_02180 [Myxococcus stipitatus]|uniref:hypothetical protein n=1 Tax=Myxococcus stipitatus TaxID=83455 RepID=UPI001F3DDCCD|nr:hypothetical protein [Myxococcus stipitatus]MCE9666608.1 hypothetical protein [Myxococcus stipitatus]
MSPSPLFALLAPTLALAQAPDERLDLQPASASGQNYWFWVALLVIAAAVFAWVAVRLSRKRRGPPRGPGARGHSRPARTL